MAHVKTLRNVQASRAPDGSPVHQQVLRHDYLAITRGPLVYASPLIDGFKTEETIRLPPGPPDEWLELLPLGSDGTTSVGPAIRVKLGYRSPLLLQPYFRAGGRTDGAWRLTWLLLAPAAAASAASAASSMKI